MITVTKHCPECGGPRQCRIISHCVQCLCCMNIIGEDNRTLSEIAEDKQVMMDTIREAKGE